MHVFLRNRRTRLYYVARRPSAGRNQPPAANAEPLDFGTVRSAAKFSLEQRLPDMEIVLRYDSCAGEVALPVLPEWCLFDERVLRPIREAA